MAGFLDALRAFFDPVGSTPAIQTRGLTYEQFWNTGADNTAANTIAGVRVSYDTAMNAPAVWACVRLISGAIAGLPLHAFRDVGDQRVEIALPEWLRRPVPNNPNITRAVHVQQVVTSLLLEGNAFIRFLPSAISPLGMVVLKPHEVTIETLAEGDVIYKWNGMALTPGEVVHIPYVVKPGEARGLNPIDAARESIGLAIAADEFGAAFFGNGAHMGGHFEGPPGWDPAVEELERMKKDFRKKNVGASKSHAIGALTGGVVFKENTSSNKDSQFLELREFEVEDIGRLYGVPPHMIGSQKPGAVAYASVEQRNIDFVTHGLQPVIEKLEDGYERVLRGQRTFFKFNVDGLLRGDAKSRWEAYGIALDKKVVTREEVRAKEDLPNIGPLGFLETPNNNAPEPSTAPAQESTDD